MKNFFRIATLILTMIMVAMVSALTAMRFAIHGQEIKVPAIIGLTPADAERSLAAAGLQIEIERQYYSPVIQEGRIMTQLPLPGAKVRRGWQVRVAQSMGPQRISIPDVTGESERAAELNLERRGLELASTAQIECLSIPPAQVIAQSPPANASQVAAPKTSLLLSAAAEPQAFVMPSLVGNSVGAASRILQDAGFKLGNVSVAPPPAAQASSSTIVPGAGATASPAAAPSSSAPISIEQLQPTPASVVVSQNPPAGQKILSGAVVNLEVR